MIKPDKIDQDKRNTLKKAAGIGVGSVALVASSSIAGLAHSASFSPVSSATDVAADVVNDLADIEVRTTVSAVSNDIEIVLTNTGSEHASITDMTPAEIHTARGKFDFNALLDNGSLELASGENIRVPIQHHTVDVLNSNQLLAGSSGSLKKKLKDTVSIVTNGDSLAVVTIA